MFSENASKSEEPADVFIATNATLLNILFGTISFLSIAGNAIVCVVFRFQFEIFGSITNILIFNQSIIDLCSGIIFAILKFAPGVSLKSLPWFTVLCYIWISEYPFWALSYASTFNLLLLAIERYFAICQAVSHRKLFTKRRVKGYCTLVWMAGFLFQVYLPIVHHTESVGRCNFEWPNKAAQIFIGTFVFMAEYLIPLMIMTSSYSLIWWNLRKRTISKTKVQVKAFAKGKRNVTITLCLVFISYVICWSPDAFVYFYFNLGGTYNFNSNTHHFVMILVLCNMLTNPCIYVFKYDRFRQQLKSIICPGFSLNTSSRSEEPSTGRSLLMIRKPMRKYCAVDLRAVSTAELPVSSMQPIDQNIQT
ncbi:somatostatin receptor type 2-like [Amphiura filiformis]|uniref:somatostatin receptor type 2-like n=1 Tax=Amphiura filiformis TaxID=82378 RepID=UPI003B21DBA9